MAINTNVNRNYQTAEYGKFVEINNTAFPPVSVTRVQYPDKSAAFPGNSAAPAVSSVDVYPKYAVLTYDINSPGQSGLAFLSSGMSSFDTYGSIQTLSATRISGLTASNSNLGGLNSFELPANFTFSGPILGITIQYGAVFAYKI
jgi:hypothetical protein